MINSWAFFDASVWVSPAEAPAFCSQHIYRHHFPMQDKASHTSISIWVPRKELFRDQIWVQLPQSYLLVSSLRNQMHLLLYNQHVKQTFQSSPVQKEIMGITLKYIIYHDHHIIIIIATYIVSKIILVNQLDPGSSISLTRQSQQSKRKKKGGKYSLNMYSN